MFYRPEDSLERNQCMLRQQRLFQLASMELVASAISFPMLVSTSHIAGNKYSTVNCEWIILSYRIKWEKNTASKYLLCHVQVFDRQQPAAEDRQCSMPDNGFGRPRHRVTEVRERSYGQKHDVGVALVAGKLHERRHDRLQWEVPDGILHAEREHLAELGQRRQLRRAPRAVIEEAGEDLLQPPPPHKVSGVVSPSEIVGVAWAVARVPGPIGPPGRGRLHLAIRVRRGGRLGGRGGRARTELGRAARPLLLRPLVSGLALPISIHHAFNDYS